MIINKYKVAFGGDGGVLKLTVAMVAYIREHNKPSHCTLYMGELCVNYISIQPFLKRTVGCKKQELFLRLDRNGFGFQLYHDELHVQNIRTRTRGLFKGKYFSCC